MTLPEAAAIAVAALGAGAANAVVGSGTLITFPTLLAFGYAPVLANVSSTVGLVFGNASSIATWRPELEGQSARARRLVVASAAGGVVGAVLLFALPASAFRSIVPAFIALGVVLILAQPWLSRILVGRSRGRAQAGQRSALLAFAGLFVVGLYGGYFGAGQGLLIFAVLGLAVTDSVHRITALRNVLAGATNAVAAVAFVVAAHVAWGPAALIAGGSIVGGWLGVHVGRLLPPLAYRVVIALVGVVAFARLAV